MESLYRKYRPQTFDDVVGQKHVVATLRRAVLEGRTSHAYLFCGPRGTGKTTMARLLAKALLCEQGPGHLPDGSCEQCQLIAAGEHPDVYELDAASNTGVDNVREEIINRVSYAPVRGNYKVYIIDEVHMLTPAAFNALLKTLEEPPEHVVFIMCTTDPQKILETILSRVQRFDFRPISNDELLGRLVYVCQQEGIQYVREALELVVLHARGGMRDALSDLERLATYTGANITLDAAQDLLGEVPASTLADVAHALAARDVPALFAEAARLVDSGRDLLQFVRELCAHLRDVYVVAAVGERPGVVSAQGEALARLAGEARSFGPADRISRAMTVLGDASNEMRTAPNQRLVLELAFTRIARPESDVTMEALAERVAVLERRLAQLEAGGARAADGSSRAADWSRGDAQGTAAAPPQASQAQVRPQTQAQPQPQAQQAPARQVQAQAQHRVQQPTQARPQAQQAPQAQPSRQQPQGTWPAAPAPQPQASTQPPRPSAQPQAGYVPQQQAASPQAAAPQTPAAITDPGDLQRRWRQVCDELLANMPSRGSLLMNSTIVSDDGQTLTVSLPKGSTFAIKMLERKDVREAVSPAVQRAFGQRGIVYAELAEKAAPAAGQAAPVATRPAPWQAAAPAQAVPAPQPAPRPAQVQAPQPAPRPAQVQAPQPAPRPAQVQAPQPAPRHEQPAVAAQPAQVAPQPAAVPAPAPRQARPAPAPQQSAPSYPMPWDDAPAYEEVPYSEADAAPYEEDEYFAPAPLPVATQSAAPAPQPAPAPAPASQPVSAAPRGAKKPVSPASAQVTAPASAARPALRPPAPEPAPQAQKAPASDEAASIMSMLTSVFGEGVTMSTVANTPQEDPQFDEDYQDDEE